MIRNTVTVLGHETVYWERDPKGARTIVMLHGFRGNHKGLADIVQHFPGYRVITPDLPGYGESEPMDVPHTLKAYALWLDGFAAALELGEWVSWSHSYSSSIALIQAVDGNHKPIVVISVSMAAIRRSFATALSSAYYQVGQLMPLGMQQRFIASRFMDHATGRWLFMTVTTRRRRELQARAEKDLPMLNPTVVTEEYFSALDTPLEAYAKAVTAPVLIIAGARDVIVPLSRLETLVALIPDGTLVIMDDQGHLAPIERPAATATITKRFINGMTT